MNANKIVRAGGLGIGGIVFSTVWGILMVIPLYLWTNILNSGIEIIINTIALPLGALTIGAIYFKYTDRGMDYIDIDQPTPKQILFIALGVVFLLTIGVIISVVTTILGVSGSEHQIYKLATTEGSGVSTTTVLVLIPLSILFVGPAEEFMFRGLVQKSLYEDHSKNESIMIASVFFSAIHIFAYFTAGLEQALISLTTILILSVFLGYMYAKTENLLVPALIHGCYNAALFALLYLELIGAFTMPT